MVFTEFVSPMLNLILSGPGMSLASCMAARKVHCLPLVGDVSHTLSLMSLSVASPVRLTVKVVTASAGSDHSARSTPASASAVSARSALGASLLALDALLICVPSRETTRTRISAKPRHDSHYPYYDRFLGHECEPGAIFIGSS
jgi:hypothetical protein